MRSLLLVFSFLICCPAWATITVAHVSSGIASTTSTANCGGNFCWGQTITSTTAGNTLLVAVLDAEGPTPTITGCYDGGDTFAAIAGARGTDTNGGSTNACWIASVSAGKTTLYAGTSDSTSVIVLAVYELSSTAALSVDNSAAADRISCTACLGIAPSLSGSNDFILQFAACQGALSAINSSYVGIFPGGEGAGYLNNSVSTTQPTWTQAGGGTVAVAYVALKEATSSPLSPPVVY